LPLLVESGAVAPPRNNAPALPPLPPVIPRDRPSGAHAMSGPHAMSGAHVMSGPHSMSGPTAVAPFEPSSSHRMQTAATNLLASVPTPPPPPAMLDTHPPSIAPFTDPTRRNMTGTELSAPLAPPKPIVIIAAAFTGALALLALIGTLLLRHRDEPSAS